MTERDNHDAVAVKEGETALLAISADGFINVGYDVFVNPKLVLAVLPTDSAPVKRLISTSKEKGAFVDGTFGRKTRGAIVMQSGAEHLCVLGTAMTSATIAARLNKGI